MSISPNPNIQFGSAGHFSSNSAVCGETTTLHPSRYHHAALCIHGNVAAASDLDMDAEDMRAAGSTADSMDEDMTTSTTPAVEGAQTPLSTHTLDAHDDSDLASSFYNVERTDAAPPASAHPQTGTAVADDDDLMEPGAPSREEGLLDEKIRARYIQEIGDIFAT